MVSLTSLAISQKLFFVSSDTLISQSIKPAEHYLKLKFIKIGHVGCSTINWQYRWSLIEIELEVKYKYISKCGIWNGI